MAEKTAPQSVTDILSFRLFTALLAIFLLCVIAGAAIISAVTSTPYLAVMNVAGVLASISLSAVLAYLYLRMSDIQSQQESIMAQQGEIMEAEHLPHLFLSNVNIKPSDTPMNIFHQISESELEYTRGELGRFSDDSVHISLHNAGNGLAKNLRLHIEVTGRNEAGTVRASSATVKQPLSKYQSEKTRTFDGQTDSNTQDNADYIESKESSQFRISPRFPVADNGSMMEVPFSFFLELCSKRDVEEIELEMKLLYRDMTNEVYELYINKETITVDEIGRATKLNDIFPQKDIVDRTRKDEIGPSDVFYPDVRKRILPE